MISRNFWKMEEEFLVDGATWPNRLNHLAKSALIPDDIKQTSGGMVAFGDMVVFMLGAGFLSLVPTWFLLTFCVENIPRTPFAVELMIAALGPASWLAVRAMGAGPTPASLPQVLGLLIAFGAMSLVQSCSSSSS